MKGGFPMKKISQLLGLMSLVTMLPMCDSAAVDYCDAWCDCHDCSDREFDDCVHDREHDADDAYDENCGGEWEDWVSCVVDTYDCDGDHLDHDCKHEHDDWKDCVK